MKKKFAITVIILFCIIAIFMGKIVRHTIMYNTLVKTGIGWYMIDGLNSGDIKFGLTIKDSSTSEATSSATKNANYIFSKMDIFNLAKTYYDYEILISTIWNVIVIFILIKMKKTYTVTETLFIVASVAVLNIFVFCLAKEPIQMIYFIFMYLILISKKDDKFKFISCLFIFVLCSFTFRNYYIIMAACFVFILILYQVCFLKLEKLSLKHFILIIFSIFVFYLVLLNVAKILSITSFNELLRVRLRTSTATSDMRAIFRSQNLFVFSIDYIIMLIRMLVPIELAKLGPKYIVYVIYQVMITCILIKNIKNINKISNQRKIAIFIYLAFLMGSVTFEPDFGSWIRHESVLFPIFMIICGFTERKKSDEKNII